MKYRKKPVEIEAVQYDGSQKSVIDILEMASRGRAAMAVRVEGTCLSVPTLEGLMRAEVGDWIIKGVAGEIYPCKPDIFQATYERAK